MQLIYDSPYYTVLEFREGGVDAPATGSYEIVDKSLRREIYLRGAEADAFRASVRELVAREPEQDEVDEFLSAYRPLMNQPVAVH
ncbi:MAG: hypothetical protein RL669_1151 [Pseudomonadota bacterium]|jgi:Protein of unknown function (DUF3567)